MDKTNIEWTDFSANPLKYRDKAGKVVWGCVKCSSGCANCYSEAIAQRFGRGGPFTAATMRDLTPFLDEKELRHILTAQKIGGKLVAGARCFLGDMTDVFGEWVPDELLDRLFGVLAVRHDVTFQVLTKRAERMAQYFAGDYRTRLLMANVSWTVADDAAIRFGADYELKHVHFGVSVENQEAADARIPHLLKVPAAVRFLSCEPLLGAVDLTQAGFDGRFVTNPLTGSVPYRPDLGNSSPRINWVIVGGESGSGARMFNVEWARSLVQQCKGAGVACFVKQLGERPVRADGRPLGAYDAEEGEFPRCSRCGHFDFGPCGDGTLLCNGCDSAWSGLRDKKGGNPDEWPADLRVREFPEVKAGAT